VRVPRVGPDLTREECDRLLDGDYLIRWRPPAALKGTQPEPRSVDLLDMVRRQPLRANRLISDFQLEGGI
jgi:hypothetical protein